MKKKTMIVATALMVTSFVFGLTAEDAKNMPAGVGRVKYNDDGSLKSLCIKATVPVDDILGVAEGKSMARTEADMEAKKLLSKWMNEEFVAADASGKETKIFTKSAKTADGKKKEVSAEQTKIMSNMKQSLTASLLKGIKPIFSDLVPMEDGESEYSVIMVMDTKDVAAALKAAETMAQKPDLSGKKLGKNDKNAAKGTPADSSFKAETKISEEADEY